MGTKVGWTHNDYSVTQASAVYNCPESCVMNVIVCEHDII